jgi:hypothetical protein
MTQIGNETTPSTAFAEWLNSGPAIAKAAGIEVQIVAVTADGTTLKLTSVGFSEGAHTRCGICNGPHDNDVLTDICTSCEARLNEEGSP